MTTVEYFEVEEHDGDRMSRVLARFDNEAAAKILAAKNPNYRNVHKRYIIIFNTIEEYDHNTDKEIRKRAIAKLDREELRVLGITVRDI